MSVVASDKRRLSEATNVDNAKGGNPGGASSFLVLLNELYFTRKSCIS